MEEVKAKIDRVKKFEEDVVYKAFAKAKEQNPNVDFIQLIVDSVFISFNPSNATPEQLLAFEEYKKLKQLSNT
jgi:N-glycosylase/DNA lyase